MERIDPNAERSFTLREHEHRYQLAAALVHGRVLDCSCGLGYGSRFLLAEEKVTSYHGIDIDEPTIEEAIRRFGGPQCSFQRAEAESLPFKDAFFDGIVCLETIEHTKDPSAVLREFRRVLKPGGILVASIPTSAHERFCTDAFGANPYHLQCLEKQTFEDLLQREIGPTTIYLALLETFTVVRDGPIPSDTTLLFVDDSYDNLLGSYISVSVTEGSPPALTTPRLYYVGACVENERDLVSRFQTVERAYIKREEDLRAENEHLVHQCQELRAAFHRSESLICARDQTIKAYEDTERQLRQIIAALELRCSDFAEALRCNEELVRARDEALLATTHLVEDRDRSIKAYQDTEHELRGIISSLELRCSDFSEALRSSEELVRARDEALISNSRLIDDRDEAIKSYKRREAELRHLIEEMERRFSSIRVQVSDEPSPHGH